MKKMSLKKVLGYGLCLIIPLLIAASNGLVIDGNGKCWQFMNLVRGAQIYSVNIATEAYADGQVITHDANASAHNSLFAAKQAASAKLSSIAALSGAGYMYKDGSDNFAYLGLGSAATLTAGVAANNLVQLNSNAAFPAIVPTVNAVTLGSNLVANGTFDSDLSGWTVGGTASGWSYSSGTALHSTGNTDTLSQNISVASGNVYYFSVVTSGVSAGSVNVSLGTVTATVDIATSATTTFSFLANATGSVALTFTPASAFNGAIDTVVLELVTAAPSLLTLYNMDFKVGSHPHNIGIGYQALQYCLSGGSANIAIGYQAMRYNTVQGNNVGIGYQALYNNITGYYNVGVGGSALTANTTGANNIAIGTQALTANTTGSHNMAIGYGGQAANTTGNNNTGVGSRVLYVNTTGSQNTGISYHALRFNTTGSYNTAIGFGALYSNTTASYNTAIGANAASNNTGASNICIGAYVDLPNNAGNAQLNIGNILYGTGIYSTASMSSTPVTGGKVGIMVAAPASALDVNGSVKVANDTDAASSSKVGSIRYRVSGNNSYVDVCMQTAASTYEWVNIITQSW